MKFTPIDRLVGQNIGRYHVVRLLEQRQVSAIYLALYSADRSPVALTTFLFPEKLSSAARHRFLQRFQAEAMRLTLLQHQHILPIYEWGEHEGYPYLITPYTTNGSLVGVMKHQKQFQYTDVLMLLQDVATALAYAHRRGMVHGTLKPSNIILGDQGQTLVAGFGLKDILQMRGIEPDDRPYGHLLNIGGALLTPPEYVAPEVIQGNVEDPRSDIYSLGMILFELLADQLPFTGANPLEVAQQRVQQQVPSLRSLCPDIPLVLASVVNQALERDPKRRFQNVDELTEAVVQVAAAISAGDGPLRRPQALMTRTWNEALLETPAEGYSIGNWQIQPPIVTGKFIAIEPMRQKPSSVTRGTSTPSRARTAQPPLFPDANEKKQEPADATASLPDQSVSYPPPFPQSVPPGPTIPVQESIASLSVPSAPQAGGVVRNLNVPSFDWWMAPSQELSASRSAKRRQRKVDATLGRPPSNRRSRSSQRRRTREKPRVSRHRIIVLLATGVVAAAASVTTVLGILYLIGK